MKYSNQILDFFLNCKQWKQIKKCLSTYQRRQFESYRYSEDRLYTQGYESLAKEMLNAKAKWCRKWQAVTAPKQQSTAIARQMTIWEIQPA